MTMLEEYSMIRQAQSNDSPHIADIYNHYIVNSPATFEEKTVTAAEIRLRIEETESNHLPYFVAESDGEVVGYAFASKWNGRCAYKFSVEVTVYLSPESTGRGYGTSLYETLLAELRNLWCANCYSNTRLEVTISAVQGNMFSP
jgi:L-amino acid N-acyltransferase YncA